MHRSDSMHCHVISVSSALAALILFAGYPAISNAHEDDKLCNVLLDGDGDPVIERDADNVDHNGSIVCEEAEKTAAPAKEIVAVDTATATVEPLTVYFGVNRDDLSAGSHAEVQSFAAQLLATNPKAVQVVGFTDTSGSADLNAELSKARAGNVVAAMLEAGVPSELISSDAAGEQNLAVDTPDGTREANNRRVTVMPQY